MPISSGCQKCRDKGCRTNFYSIQTAITQNSRHPTLLWQKIMSKGMFCPQTQTTESLGKMARPSFSLLLLLSCSPDIDSTELILGKNNKTTRRKNRRVQVRTRIKFIHWSIGLSPHYPAVWLCQGAKISKWRSPPVTLKHQPTALCTSASNK